MKRLVQKVLLYSLSLFILSEILAGVHVLGGIGTFLLGGIVFTLMSLTVKPILQILALPLNLVTFGLFSSFINVVILYLLTVLVPQITITAFTFPGFSSFGFVIPEVDFSTFSAYIVASILFSLTTAAIVWVTDK